MVKMVYCLRRLPHLSREEFQRYWHEQHGPLVRKHAATLLIRRYLQVHTKYEEQTEPRRIRLDQPEPYDGIAELWWDSIEDRSPQNSSAERRQAAAELFADEQKFIDISRSPIWLGEEHVFVGD